MKPVVWIVIVLLFAAGALALRMQQKQNSSAKKQDAVPATREPMETYLGLRNQVLHGSRAQLSLPDRFGPHTPWGILMDFQTSKRSATVMALADGSASIYISNGGGYLGGIGHEAIRKAAEQAVAVAGEFQPQMKLTKDYPLPQQGTVIFYVLTDSGVFTTEASEDDLVNRRLPLSKLYYAGQEIITQFRLLKK
jgi:hypothetical protein